MNVFFFRRPLTSLASLDLRVRGLFFYVTRGFLRRMASSLCRPVGRSFYLVDPLYGTVQVCVFRSHWFTGWRQMPPFNGLIHLLQIGASPRFAYFVLFRQTRFHSSIEITGYFTPNAEESISLQNFDTRNLLAKTATNFIPFHFRDEF